MPTADPSRPTVRATRPMVAWLAVAVVLAVIGWGKTINLLLLVGYVMLALAGVNAVLARRAVRAVVCRARPVGAAFAGGPMAVAVEVENVGRTPAAVEVEAPGVGRPSRWFVGGLGPGEAVTLRDQPLAENRGRHRPGEVTAECDYPFGLVRWRRTFGPGGEVVVLPRLGRVSLGEFRRWLVRTTGGEARRRRPSRRPLPGTGDVCGVRPYRVGDSIRDVHWRTTARRNELAVREYDRVEAVDLTLIVDRTVPPDADPAAFERLLELAVSIGWAWSQADEPGGLTLVVPGELPIVRSPRTDAAAVRAAFEVLADLTPIPSGRAGGDGVPATRANATSLLVTTRPGGGPVAAALKRAGSGVVWVGPDPAPRWYHPPAGLGPPDSRSVVG